jgi:hypothetical protein
MITIVKLLVVEAVRLFHSFLPVDTFATLGAGRSFFLFALPVQRFAAQPLPPAAVVGADRNFLTPEGGELQTGS